MIPDEILKVIYDSLPTDEKLKLALYSDFGQEASAVYDFIKSPSKESEQVNATAQPVHIPGEVLATDGVYYLYEDGTSEMFDYQKRNAPTKTVKRIGVVMGSHAIAVNLGDYPKQSLTVQIDRNSSADYILKNEDAVADWDGKVNTEHIKSIGTDIQLKDDEWIPSVAELYLIYLNKRSINVAIKLSGGTPIAGVDYWSSTEYSAAGAWYLNLNDGEIDWSSKEGTAPVRAVAAFH